MKLNLLLLTASLIALSACDMGSGSGNQTQTQAQTATSAPATTEAAAPAMVAQVDGNRLTYGAHEYTVDGLIDTEAPVTGRRDTPTATVTFTNVPADYAEFEAVYSGLLGRSPQGAAAMIPMAIEIFARDNAIGEQCLKLLCNSDATVSGIVRILKTKLIPSEHAPANDPYIQRYMAAALLKGANADNAYTPTRPYTVEMCASVNKPQQASGGTVTYLYILANGWDSNQRQVEVQLPNGSELYKVFNCPSTYTQCKNIVGTWSGLE